MNQPRQGYVVYYDTRRAAARRRLDRTLDLLRKAGVPATGVVVEADPVVGAPRRDRAAGAGRDHRLDAPAAAVGLAATQRRRADARAWPAPIPFEHVVVDLAAEHGEANVLVVANQTVLGEPLLAKIRERAARAPPAS